MKNTKVQTSSVLLVIAAAMLWGTTGTSQALAPTGASPLTIGAVRLAIGGTVLFIFALMKGSWRGFKGWPFLTTVVAAVSMAAYQPFFFAGVSKTGVAVGTIVTIGSAPVFAGILAYLVRGEKPNGKWKIATGLAILGNLFLLMSEKDISLNVVGIMMALGAGLAYAVYALASKELLDQHPSELVVAVVFSLGAILLSPLLFISDLTWLMDWRGSVAAIHLGVFATAVAYLLFSRGLAKISVADAVTLTLAEPLTAAVLGIFILGEKLNLQAFVGLLLLLAGILLLSINFKRWEKQADNNEIC